MKVIGTTKVFDELAKNAPKNATELMLRAVTEWAKHGLTMDLQRDSSEEALADYKVMVNDALKLMRDADAELVNVLDAIFSGLTVLEDGTTVEVKKGVSGGKWDSDALIRLLVSRSRDECWDPETGEFLTDPVEAAVAALRRCSAIENPSHGWRAGEVKKALPADQSIDEYRTGGSLKTSVIVTPAKKAEEAA